MHRTARMTNLALAATLGAPLCLGASANNLPVAALAGEIWSWPHGWGGAPGLIVMTPHHGHTHAVATEPVGRCGTAPDRGTALGQDVERAGSMDCDRLTAELTVPLPEPAPVLLIVAGLVAFVWRRRGEAVAAAGR